MNTLHFRYAIEIEKTGSISKAAENLFMAQPNLSKAIKELEQSLNIVIFERTSRGVRPTMRGKEFLDRAKSVLLEIDQMKNIQNRGLKSATQMIKVSIPRGTYISKAFSQLVGELDMEKEIDLYIKETNSIETVMNVADNYYDFGIIRYQNDDEKYFLEYVKTKNLDYSILWEFECLAAMNPKNKHVNDKNLTFEALEEDCIEIVYNDNVVPFVWNVDKKLENHSGNSKRRVHLFERGSQFEILVSVPNTYMWTSPLPKSTIDLTGFVQRKCYSPHNKFKDVLVWKKGHELSELDNRFIEKLKKEIEILKLQKYE